VESENFEEFYQSRSSQKFLTSDNPHTRLLLNRMIRWLNVQPDDAVLDVGCADGYFLQEMAKCSPFAKGVGVDLSKDAVESARKTGAKFPQLSFIPASAADLPFDDRSFEKILVNEVIEHVPDDGAVFAEVARVAKQGALVYMTAPNDFSEMLGLFHAYCRRMDRLEGHLRRYTKRAFVTRAAEFGFDLVNFEYSGFLANYLWYSLVVYNSPLKSAAMRLLSRSNTKTMSSAAVESALPDERPAFNKLAAIPFAAMHTVSALDRPFAHSRRCMGFHALLLKR
jgi:ubiquinone/menaquinone biosynthesis C-methylase UbiE